MRPTRRAAKRSFTPVESSDDDQPIKKKSPQQLPQQLDLSDDSSSDSDIGTYLKPPSKLDLDSSFFNTRKTNDPETEETKEVSDSGSNTVEEEIPMMDFGHINSYNKKLEEARRFIEAYKAKKAEEGKPDEVSDILKLGEGINEDDEFFNSLRSEDFETVSDSDKEDWEVVEGKDDKIEEKRGVEITINAPTNVKKKKGVDLMAMVKRRINRVKKETQVFIHKVHLLTWVAHGLSVNNVLNDQSLLGLGLSLLPSQHCLPKNRLDITYLETIVNWYRKLIVNKELPGNPKKQLVKSIEEQILKKEAYNHKYFVYIFLIILRSLGFSCRLVLSLQVQPLRPPQNELLSVSNKKEPPEEKTPKPIKVPSSKLNSSKILDKSISSTKKLKDKLNLSKGGLIGRPSTSKIKETKSDGITEKQLKPKISNKKENKIKTSGTKVHNTKSGVKLPEAPVKNIEKDEKQSKLKTSTKKENIASKKRINSKEENKVLEKDDTTVSKSTRTSRRIHKNQEILSKENPTEEEILKNVKNPDKTAGKKQKKTTKGLEKPGDSTDINKVIENLNENGSKTSNNSQTSSNNTEENAKPKAEVEENPDKTDGKRQRKTTKNLEKPPNSTDIRKVIENINENGSKTLNIGQTSSNNTEKNPKPKAEEEENPDKTDGKRQGRKTRKDLEKPSRSTIMNELTKKQTKLDSKLLNNGELSKDKESTLTTTSNNPEENAKPIAEVEGNSEENQTDRRKKKKTIRGVEKPGSSTDQNGTIFHHKNKESTKKLISNNPQPKPKRNNFKVKLPIKKKMDPGEEQHFTSDSEEEIERNFQILKPKQVITPKIEPVTPRQPTPKSDDDFLGFDESIPQFDGANDTDSSSSSKNRKNKPNLSKLKSPEKCEVRNCQRRLNRSYVETDSDEDFSPKATLPRRKPSASSSSDSDRSRFFNKLQPRKLDVRNDIMSLVQRSITEEKLDKRRKLVKRKSNSGDDGDYLPPEMKKVKVDDFKEKTVTKVKRRVPTRKELLELEEKKKVERDEKRKSKGVNVWIEVFAEAEEKWISVDIDKGQVHCVKEISTRATHPISYILAFDNTNHIKDITKRYCSTIWNTTTRKLRVDDVWWESTLKPYRGPKTPQDKEEDEDLARIQLEQPLPTTISEYKNHPLYVLRRHLLKFEAIYPPDALTLGFVRNEPVYSRDCVYTLHSRDIWLKHAKVVKQGETPYKIVKARPKYDKLSNTVITDQPLEVFGEWQIEDYVPPTAENGIVPRNAYGNVELFKACMIPKGTVHLQLPGLNKVAKKLNIDCAPAVVGFDFHSGWSHPTFDGFVVCEEFAETLTAAWFEDQVEAEKRAEEKIEKRVYGNWRRLIRGLLIRERLKIKYDFGNPSTSAQPEKSNKKITKKS